MKCFNNVIALGFLFIAPAIAPGGEIGQATWWSLKPLNRPPVPAVDSDWVLTPVDAFILAKARSEHLTVSREADRRTLMRRVTFDLIGLPPTPEEVASFVNDPAPDAYEKWVDRLLDSPRYGERWGRHWLDVVHYADTHGYDKDKRRDHAWPYRDYVIRAFNDDKPYARFVTEQLAGDAVYPDEPDGILATGFITAGPWDFVGHVELREGTVEKAKTRSLDRDDMVATTASTFSSMTVNCARCHDHKFDPLTQTDYYSMQAVFAGVDRGDRPYPSPEHNAAKAALEKQKKQLTARRDGLNRQADAVTQPKLKAIDQQIAELKRDLAGIPQPILPEKSPTNGYHSKIEKKQDVVKWVQLDLGRSMPIEAIRLIPARPTDFPDTPGFGFPVRFRIDVADDADFAAAISVADHTTKDFKNPSDDPYVVTPPETSARYVRVTVTKLWPRTNDYVFALAEIQIISSGKDVAHHATTTALDTIDAGRWHTKNLTDGYTSRNKLADMSIPVVAAMVLHRDQIPTRLRQLERDRKKQFDSLLPSKLKTDLEKAKAALADVTEQIKHLPAAPVVYAVKSIAPRPIHLLNRGDVQQERELVGPGALACVAGLPARFELSDAKNEADRRAALARWIVDNKNVLTWRSIVNRIWHYHFGRGIVDTPNDFGRNGGSPTHPELLDWLAVEFRDNGGSIKNLHRLILRSSVYRQSSANNPANAKIDAGNRYLWRMNRSRLEAEEVRDTVLAVSGQLNLKMGGPGFELFDFEDDHSPRYDYVHKDTPEAHRRSVYRFIVRSVPDPFMDTLDCADPNVNVPVRNRTLTALQALALLNNPFMLRQSEYLAEKIASRTDPLDAQMDAAYEATFARLPSASERNALAAYAKAHGLANACRVLFNTNEFLFID